MTFPQIVVCAVGFLEAIVYGYSFPYFTLLLEQRQLSNTLIGANAMLGTLGALAIGPFIPWLVSRLGYRKFSIAALVIVAIIFSAAAVANDTVALFAYRIILGMALAGLWISTEAWLNYVVSDHNRGFMNGFFQTLYSFGFFLGPNLSSLTEVSGSTGPAVAALVALLGIAVCLSISNASHHADGDFEAPLDWRVAWRAKQIMIIAMLTGISETAMYTLLPVYGLDIGFKHQVALSILVFYTFGEVILTLPLGWAADRLDRRKLLVGSAFAASFFVAGLALSGAVEIPAKAFAFMAGGLIVSLYNLALVVLGETYQGTDLPVVSTAFSMSYSAGCAAGATIGGIAMDGFGPYGLPIMVAAVLSTFGIGAALTMGIFKRSGKTASLTDATSTP